MQTVQVLTEEGQEVHLGSVQGETFMQEVFPPLGAKPAEHTLHIKVADTKLHSKQFEIELQDAHEEAVA